ncbi:vacuolar proton ATPase [Pelomyxa schiedti]|nr:vacuolar proton ATPase [Pelomyxa schiedti]
MGTLWRSQPMQLVQLVIQTDSAHDTMVALGAKGKLQLKDLNESVNSFQRNFVTDVKRCEEMERRLRYVEQQIFNEKEALAASKHSLADYRTNRVPERIPAFNDLEGDLANLERELQDINANREVLDRNYSEFVEMQQVLLKDNDFFSEGTVHEKKSEGLLDDGFSVKLGYVTGVINLDLLPAFERMMWRALRGNMVNKTAPIEELIIDNTTGLPVRKAVFIVFYQGEQPQQRIKKICESFGAHTYVCPDNMAQREELLEQVRRRLNELSVVRDRAHEHRRQLLASVDQVIQEWVFLVRKEKSVYHALNMFNYDHGRKVLIGEGWCPCNATDEILDALNDANKASGSPVPSILGLLKSKEEPPTYFETNKFTYAMHCIIEAYGVARYGEINPTTFSIVTFPFLFAVMFGDAGHAVMLLMTALTLILFEKKLSNMQINEIFKMLFDGRYVLLLMSCFSIFTGLIYNDIFGLGVSLLPTAWYYNATALEWQKEDRVYEFGIDCTWKGADNELYFYNSFKMKLSIVFGVVQMTVGIFLNALNFIHFRKWLSFFFEFIPQLFFMTLIFGYLVILIFLKWSIPLKQEPYLINVIIDIFLKCPDYPEEDIMFDGQATIQVIIFFVSIICVFVMLIPKPIILKVQHNRAMKMKRLLRDIPKEPEMSDENEIDPAPKLVSEGPVEDDEEPFDFSEIIIHQSIHTIEFVLGCISNTASYLRLWALSLAHAELSIVFYEQVLVLTMGMDGTMAWFIIVGGWALWAAATVAVLLVMEALSAFLHALRLHWVEFQNKFYQGDGYAFAPLDFSKIRKTLLDVE